MGNFNVLHFAITITSLFCTLAGIKILMQKKENKLLAQQLTETTVSLEQYKKNLAKLQEKHAGVLEFQNSLHEAELTTKLQKPRLNGSSYDAGGSAPEKYRYIHSLTEKGMSSEEIASVLTISEHEADQLVSLSKLAMASQGVENNV